MTHDLPRIATKQSTFPMLKPCYPLVICYIAIENGHRNN